jgi:hypothetical protein
VGEQPLLKEQMKLVSALSIAALLCACGSLETTVISKGNGLMERRQYDQHGRIVRVESYYLTANGKKVLHGECEKWSPPGARGIQRVYKHGVIVRIARVFSASGAPY